MKIENKIINKKAFTLVELLAVLAILALVVTISTPIVLNVVKKAENSTENHTIELYGRAVKQAALEYQLDGEDSIGGYYISNKNGTIITNLSNNTKIKINYSGNKVICDDIHISQSSEIYLNNCSVDDKKVQYYYGKNVVEEPDLYNGTLTPVMYDGDNWIVVDSKEKWYDYEKQQWANAVILNNNSTKKEGDTLVVDGDTPDILGMYVWIPRFEYKIEGTYGKGGTSTASPGKIEVNFIFEDETTPTNGYRIHPAFNFGGTEINGIWVGKFEVGHATKTSSMNCTDENCEEGNSIRVLPNKKSLRSTTVSSFFYGIRSMSKEGNVFGIDRDITDTHIMKNSEWGAVAYLSQSQYGKYGNNDYAGIKKEVYINNSSNFITGRSGGSYGGNTSINTIYTDQTDVTTQYIGNGFYTYDGYLLSYNTNTKTETRDMKKIASTTGNIYGIYDMSGGAWEYTMGVFANSDGALWSGNSEIENSGFEGKVGESGTNIIGLEWPKEKYYDVYKLSSATTINSKTACNGGICYGHALSETANWYGDYSYFVSASYPWFIRGGGCYDDSGAGVFGLDNNCGHAIGGVSARVVFTQSA